MILFKGRARRRALAERIEKLEQWHHIFDEFKDEGYDLALEMAKGGVSYLSYLLRKHYFPAISEAFDSTTFCANLSPESPGEATA